MIAILVSMANLQRLPLHAQNATVEDSGPNGAKSPGIAASEKKVADEGSDPDNLVVLESFGYDEDSTIIDFNWPDTDEKGETQPLEAVFRYPLKITYQSLGLELACDAAVFWVKPSKGRNEYEGPLQAFLGKFDKLEIYAEGFVRLRAKSMGAVRAERVFLSFVRVDDQFVMQGLVTQPRSHVYPDGIKGQKDSLGRGTESDEGGEVLVGSEDEEDIPSTGETSVNLDAVASELTLRTPDQDVFVLERGLAIFFRGRELLIRNLPTSVEGTKSLEFEEVEISTSSLAIPNYAFEADAMRIDMRPTRRGVTLRRPGLAFRGQRILSIPDDNYYYDIDSRFPVTRLRIGDSSAFGRTVRFKMDVITAYDFFLDPEPTFRPFEFSPIFDYYSARGIGTGAEFVIGDIRPFATGFNASVEGYYIGDRGDDRDIAKTLGFSPIRSRDRSRIRGFARARLPGDFQVDANVNYQSDRNVLQEFFRREYRTNEPDRSFLRIRKDFLNRSHYLDFSFRALYFRDEVENLPEVGFGTWREAILPRSLGLFLSADASVGHYRLHLQDRNHPDHLRSVLRADTQFRLYRPLDFSRFTLEPYVGLRGTISDTRFSGPQSLNPLYSSSAGFAAPAAGYIVEDMTSRGQFLAGASLSTNFVRNFRAFRSEFFGMEGLRHVITPQVEWTFVRGPSERSHEFVQMDEVDGARNENTLRFRLRNRFLTRRYVNKRLQTQDFADLLVEIPMYLNSKRDNGGQRFGELELRARLRPTSHIAFQGGGFFEPEKFHWQRLYASLGVATKSSDWRLFLRNVRGEHAVVGGQVIGYLSDTYKVALTQEYDIKAAKALDTSLDITRAVFEAIALNGSIRRDGVTRDVSFSINVSATFGPRRLTGY